MIVSLYGPTAVASKLLGYLGDRLGRSDLRFAEEPEQVNDGWETFLYRFRLQADGGIPEPFTRPLVLRLYSNSKGLPRLRHEFAAQQHMGRVGYPVANPLLLEEKESPLGGPFMIMERAPGQTFLDYMLRHPWRIIDGPTLMAELHARVHRLPADGFPTRPGPFLTHHFQEMRAIIEDYQLPGLKPGLDWLYRHRPAPPRRPSIVHLDYHPLNLIYDRDHFTAVLDWTESDVGDAHADIAATIVLFKAVPVQISRFMHRLAALPGRGMLRRRYVRAYRRLLPLDRGLLSYYTAWASFRRLCAWGRWLCAGPQSTGGKPSSMRHLSPNRVNFLRRYFERWSGVSIEL
jgi:aminoglycoside phosphotransferase (APT) family kinase protein